MPLTQKQKNFADALLRGHDRMHAYKHCYNTKDLKEETIQQRAAILAQSPKIQEYINGHQHTHIASHPELLKGEISNMLMKAFQKAEQDTRGASAMITATMALAKLHGFLLETSTQQGQSDHQYLMERIDKARKRALPQQNTSEEQ